MKIFTSLLVVVMVLVYTNTIVGQNDATSDTLNMAPGYTNDIFYSLDNGTINTVERANWEIAFYTARFSAGILINDGSGVMLYTYPKGDTSAWATVDTVGLSNWKPLYNSEMQWEEGAFVQNALGHPDYGWGIYNMVTHHVYGDSLFLINIPEVGIKKLWIKEKQSADNIYLFKYADLDGSNEQDVELDVKPYENKRFIYYSLTENMAVDREPEAEQWDILFTKYVDMVPDNEGNLSPYIVTGATSNVAIGTNRFHPVEPGFNDWSATPFDSTKNNIGYDWKDFDLGSFSWVVLDSNYYFVQTYGGDVYKLWFTMWEGTGTGKFALSKEMVSVASIQDFATHADKLLVYPNPTSANFTIRSEEVLTGTVNISITDLAGRLIYQEQYAASDLNNGISIVDQGFTEGFYIVNVGADGFQKSRKLIVR